MVSATSERKTGSLERRAQLEAAYLAVVHRSPRRDELDGLEAVAGYLAVLFDREGPVIKRTWPQMGRELAIQLGWRRARGVRQAHDWYRNRLHRKLSRLQQLGYVERFEAEYQPNREGTGIRIWLRPSVGALAHTTRPPGRRRRSRPRSSSSPAGDPPAEKHVGIGTPLRGYAPPEEPPSLCSGGSKTAAGARTRAHRAAIEAWGWRECRAALEAINDGLQERGGLELVSAHPWIAQVPVCTLARAALALYCPDASPAISAKRQGQLEAAVRRLDRLAGSGYGRARLLDVIRSGALSATHGHHRPLLSLGGAAVRLRRIANGKRRKERSHGDRSQDTAGGQPAG